MAKKETKKFKSVFVDVFRFASFLLVIIAFIGLMGLTTAWLASNAPMKDCYYKQEIQVGGQTTKVIVTDFPCD